MFHIHCLYECKTYLLQCQSKKSANDVTVASPHGIMQPSNSKLIRSQLKAESTGNSPSYQGSIVPGIVLMAREKDCDADGSRTISSSARRHGLRSGSKCLHRKTVAVGNACSSPTKSIPISKVAPCVANCSTSSTHRQWVTEGGNANSRGAGDLLPPHKVAATPTGSSDKDASCAILTNADTVTHNIDQKSEDKVTFEVTGQQKRHLAQQTVSVVVVRPKPGSKIVGYSQRRNTFDNKRTVGSLMLKCSLCSFSTMSGRELMHHKERMHNMTNPMCCQCGAEYSSAMEVMTHSCPASFRCPHCGLQLDSQENHDEHCQKRVCTKCCFSARCEEELDAHLCGAWPVNERFRVASGKAAATSTFDCGPCECKFEADVKLTSGNQEADEQKPSFPCEVCLHAFSTERALLKHPCFIAVSSESSTSFPSLAPTPMRSHGLPVDSTITSTLFSSEAEKFAKFYSTLVYNE